MKLYNTTTTTNNNIVTALWMAVAFLVTTSVDASNASDHEDMLEPLHQPDKSDDVLHQKSNFSQQNNDLLSSS
jgi:hypothetical protein